MKSWPEVFENVGCGLIIAFVIVSFLLLGKGLWWW